MLCALGWPCLRTEVQPDDPLWSFQSYQFYDSINGILISDATTWKTIFNLYMTTPVMQKLHTGASNMNTYEISENKLKTYKKSARLQCRITAYSEKISLKVFLKANSKVTCRWNLKNSDFLLSYQHA